MPDEHQRQIKEQIKELLRQAEAHKREAQTEKREERRARIRAKVSAEKEQLGYAEIGKRLKELKAIFPRETTRADQLIAEIKQLQQQVEADACEALSERMNARSSATMARISAEKAQLKYADAGKLAAKPVKHQKSGSDRNRDRHSPGYMREYMRDYMRRRRAAQKE
jgi:hypothetical protein